MRARGCTRVGPGCRPCLAATLLSVLALGSAARGPAAPDPAAAAEIGELEITVDGVPKRLVVIGSQWMARFGNVTKKSIGLAGGGRYYLASMTPVGGRWDPKAFYRVPLLGRSLSYTVDLGAVGCSCNAALYLVQMPGYNATGGGHPDPTPAGDYYCGANAGKHGGNFCPELDVLEANKYAMQTTAHTCSTPTQTAGRMHRHTAPGGGYFPMCDEHGCHANSFSTSPSSLGPSAAFVIDSRRPFRHTSSYVATPDGSTLARITNVLEQPGRRYQFDTMAAANETEQQCWGGRHAEYMANMTSSIDSPGMVATFSLWGLSNRGMGWLDGMTGCAGDCDVAAAKVVFSDIAIATTASTADIATTGRAPRHAAPAP